MKILPTFLLVLVGLLGSLATQEQSNASHAIWRIPRRLQPLTSFTVCLRAYTNLTHGYSLFSYATRQNDNHIVIHKPKPNQYSLYVDGAGVTFSIPEKPVPTPQREHICMSWESDTGLVGFWLNGVRFPHKVVKQGLSVPTGGSIIRAQEQDSLGGGFEANQPLEEDLDSLIMWGRALTLEDVDEVFSESRFFAYLMGWRVINIDPRPYVVLMYSLM